MDEKEFRKLLEKSLEGSLTKKEEDVLDTFQNNLKAKLNTNTFEDNLEKEAIKASIWTSIQQVIGLNSQYHRNSINWRRLATVAAVFIGFMICLVVYLKASNNSIQTLTKDTITLELEDGTIKVLDDKTNGHILDTSGKIVGAQNNNQLVYQKSENVVKKLVYNTLTIPYGKKFEIQLSDGTKAYLNAGSSFKYPVEFIDGKERKVFINGEVFLDVTKSEISPFIVNADDLNIKVYGTKFNVHSYPEDNVTEVVLVEGSVGLYTEDAIKNEKINLLQPNYKASFNRTEKTIKQDRVITDIYTSWMNGELVFRNMMFNNILKKLERHYDVTIINNNVQLSSEKFNASFGISPKIEEVLEELKLTYNIDYSIKQNTITIN